jgi:hypothetical protein
MVAGSVCAENSVCGMIECNENWERREGHFQERAENSGRDNFSSWLGKEPFLVGGCRNMVFYAPVALSASSEREPSEVLDMCGSYSQPSSPILSRLRCSLSTCT